MPITFIIRYSIYEEKNNLLFKFVLNCYTYEYNLKQKKKGRYRLKAYMTNGTYDFLKKLESKHPQITFHFMRDINTLAYYEGTGKSIFTAGRTYDILFSKGTLQEKGFVVMNHIPVTVEGQPVFEDRFAKRQGNVETMPGFQAFRLLKPEKGHTYIVFTQWDTKVHYENWKTSKSFQKAHQQKTVKQPAYFADRPFLHTYHLITEEEQD